MKWTRSIAPLALAGLLGCGFGGQVRLVPVKGTVTLDGKPLAKATVSFLPNPQNAAQTPGGDVTGPDGEFAAIYEGRTGLAPGKYKVLVAASRDLPPTFKAPPGMENDPTEARKALGLDSVHPSVKPRSAGVKGYEAIPPADFDVDVPDAGATALTFDVKSPSPGKKALAKK
jgi:hypothetical protein